MLSTVNAPVLIAELAVQAVADLVHVVAVEAGVESFVTFIIGDGVTFLIAHPHVVIAVECLAHEDELRFYFVGEAAELPQIEVA